LGGNLLANVTELFAPDDACVIHYQQERNYNIIVLNWQKKARKQKKKTKIRWWGIDFIIFELILIFMRYMIFSVLNRVHFQNNY